MEQLLTDITALSSKGQVVLPKSIRESLSLSIGAKFMVFTDGENILLKPIKNPNKDEFLLLVKQTEKWAKSVGMKKSDIPKAIKAVRKTNSQKHNKDA